MKPRTPRSGIFGQPTSMPADDGTWSDPVLHPRRIEPAPNGTQFRFFPVLPEDPAISREELERRYAELFAKMGASHCRVDTSRHPAMHQSKTVDHIILLSGKVTLLLDEGEADLEPFDVVIQRGTNHAWVNRGTELAILAAFSVDAKPLR